MRFDLNNNKLTIYLEGRIDSNNAVERENEIFDIISKNPYEKLVLDLETLEYISSAGLRIILKIKKMEANVELINVNTEIYEIFDMTGFAEMMTIKKAYKKISIEGCEKIGEGANGSVYRVDPETIVKVYKNPDSFADIERERKLAKKAFVLGIPTAISYEIAKIGDNYGTVFELLNAKSFAKLLAENPSKMDEYVKLYIDLLKKIHSTIVDDKSFDDMRETAISWAMFDKDYLPKEIGDKLVELVKAVPYSTHMLHGDYHVKNVLMQNGEVLLIDMDTLCVGNPIFELGSMFNAYKGFAALNDSVTLAFMGIPNEICVEFWRKTLKAYLNTDDDMIINAVENKARVIGYMRLLRRLIRRGGNDGVFTEENLEFYKQKLIEIVPTIDSLAI